MVAVLKPPEQAEQYVILNGIKWETYECLLEDLAGCRAPRLTFDQGTLEIMSPTAKHEEHNRTIALLVEVTAEEMGVDIRRFGSTTFKRDDLLKGFEPDSCFYIQSMELISGKQRLDLHQDPPPDLVIEVDITSPSLNRFPIFAKIGIPELWRYDGKQIQIFSLAQGEYTEMECSIVLPSLNSAAITQFIAESTHLKSTTWLRRVREWLRSQPSVIT